MPTRTPGQIGAKADTLPSLLLNSAAAANAVMLGAGYFNPLSGYMNLADALSVAADMQTTAGLFWPVPVVNLTRETGITAGSRIALRDPNVEGNPVLAVMDVEAVETVSDEQIATMAADFWHQRCRPPRCCDLYRAGQPTGQRPHSGTELQLLQQRIPRHLPDRSGNSRGDRKAG